MMTNSKYNIEEIKEKLDKCKKYETRRCYFR